MLSFRNFSGSLSKFDYLLALLAGAVDGARLCAA